MWQQTKNVYHLSQALTAHALHGFPARGVVFIGVTGTDGKTTTASMIYHILHRTGQKVALISTVAAIIDGKTMDTGFHVTTPDPWQIPKYIKMAKKAGAKYIILETTSHALDQNRVFAIPFYIGVITNITHEHLDYHKTYEKYVDAKFKLLKNSKIAVVNKDDNSYTTISNKLQLASLAAKQTPQALQNRKIITYGLQTNTDINPKAFPFKTNLLGDFNKYNCLAAIAVCLNLGVEPEMIRSGLADFISPEGRTEIVYDGDFKVMIDFAHTPNSIENLLLSVKKEMQPKGRIIHVFGSAGRRDPSKRAFMGEASNKYADIIILTAEDPRDEKVEEIIKQINEGIHGENFKFNATYFHESNRQKAIDKAIAMAEKDDVVVITGKGHEKSMNMGQGEVSWSDHEAVKKALGKMRV